MVETGIGVTVPVQKFDVDGAIKIGNSTTTGAGSIRFTGTDFEGYTSGGWQSFTGGGSSLWTQLPTGEIRYFDDVGIMSPSNPVANFDVQGTVYFEGSFGRCKWGW